MDSIEKSKQHGGKREGAGRKPGPSPLQRVTVTLPSEMVANLKARGGGNLSKGIRRLYQDQRA